VTVCHYPTGCSKWNPIEHRLFGPLSLHWAGYPLRTWETMLALIRGTTTTTGLDVQTVRLDGVYDTGLRVAVPSTHLPAPRSPAAPCSRWPL
jgi:hypothetical protein